MIKPRILPAFLLFALVACNQTPLNQGSKTAKKNASGNPLRETVMRSADTTSTLPDAAGQQQSKLKGRWMRSDGDYIIEVFEAAADGTLKAAYYNPGQINVEKGEWTIQDSILYMRIVLRDVNYPGSVYTLQYYRDNDALAGIYFQAVEGINYDVFFTRKK